MVTLALAAALALAGCPHDASLGAVRFVRAGHVHRVSLGDCVDHVVGRARERAVPAVRSPDGRFDATIRASGRGKTAKQTIWITYRASGRAHPVFSETQSY